MASILAMIEFKVFIDTFHWFALQISTTESHVNQLSFPVKKASCRYGREEKSARDIQED
jgi:hypothetical protein